MVEAEGIPSGAVKCTEIRKNTRGESALLGHLLTLRDESQGSEKDQIQDPEEKAIQTTQLRKLQQIQRCPTLSKAKKAKFRVVSSEFEEVFSNFSNCKRRKYNLEGIFTATTKGKGKGGKKPLETKGVKIEQLQQSWIADSSFYLYLYYFLYKSRYYGVLSQRKIQSRGNLLV